MKMVKDSADDRISFHVSELENLHGPVAQSESYFSQRLKVHKFRAYTHFIAGAFFDGLCPVWRRGCLALWHGCTVFYNVFRYFVLRFV